MAFERMQNLMSSAGEALGLTEDPLHTLIGEKLVEASDEGLVTENWESNLLICDLINTRPQGPEQAVRAFRKRLEQTSGQSPKSTLLTLTVIETCVKNCRPEFLQCVCTRDFAEFLISRVISPHLDPGPQVQTKVLSLLQSWAHAFSHDPQLQGPAEVYIDLKKKGIQFPVPSDDDLLLVQTMAPSPTHSASQHKPRTPTHHANTSPATESPGAEQSPVKQSEPAAARPRSRAAYQKLSSGQINKISRDIQITQRHLDVFSELLTELVPGEEDPEDLELLIHVATTSKEMQDRVGELVRMVEHREITVALLEINDRILSEMVRFQRYENKRRNKEAETTKTTTISEAESEEFTAGEVLLQLPSAAGGASSSSRPVSQVSNTSVNSSSTVKQQKDSDFQEIEEWMKENEGNEELMRQFEQEAAADGEAGEATTEEFDSFLRRRAEAAAGTQQ